MNRNLFIAFCAIFIVGTISVLFFWFFARRTDGVISNNVKKSGTNLSAKIQAQSSVDGGFVFAVEADPHMDGQSDPQIYKQTLQNIVNAKPAFLVDLGDIFMVDKLSEKSETNIRNRYVLLKSYYDLLGSIPLFFAMGNHDGETGWDTLYTKNNRGEYFPDQTYDKNYYSFEREHALFIVLDPYMYTSPKPGKDGWGWTLGKTQYDWLKFILENSKADNKFVFIHHLVGGDGQGRGGVEFAKLYEWGGYNQDGSYGFDARRPGWGKPIHQLLADNNVDIIFKGHDHFYAKQELDGIIYQTVPQPSHPGETPNTVGDYGYKNGTILGGSGYLKVSFVNAVISVEFIKADGTVADNYTK